MEIAIILVTGTLCMACFFIGAKVGQNVSLGKDIETPNPIKSIRQYREDKQEQEEIEKAQEELSVMMDNINIYDGTGIGQKDIE